MPVFYSQVIVLAFKLALFFCVAAVSGFALAITVEQLALINIAEQTTRLACLLLLTAFSMLMLTGFAQMSRLTLASLGDYFSQSQCAERKLLFYINKHNHLNRLFQLQKQRLLYDSQQHRKRLLRQSGSKPTQP